MDGPINDLRRKHFETEDGLVPFLMDAHEVAHILNISIDTVRTMIKTGVLCAPAPFQENPDKKTPRWRIHDLAQWLDGLRRINEKRSEIPEELR